LRLPNLEVNLFKECNNVNYNCNNSPTHAQFTSLLRTLAGVRNKEVNCACVGKLLQSSTKMHGISHIKKS
jgi:hypothetical protein